MPNLSYSNPDFVAFTKIKSADVNAKFNDIKTLLNTTKLDSTNVQLNGLTRDRLALGVAYRVTVNDSVGNLTDGTQLSTAAIVVADANGLPTPGAAPGTAGNVLTSNGTAWTSAAPSSTPPSADLLANVGIDDSATAGDLTLALKQADGSTDPAAGNGAAIIGFRSSTATTGAAIARSQTAALSLTIPLNTTLGIPINTAKYLWIYAIDSDGAGAIKLGASSILWDEKTLQSTVKASHTGTVTIATPGVWTATAHGRQNNDAVRLTTTGALPTGLSSGTTYYVVNRATDTFELSLVPGGASIDTSGSQSGVHTVYTADGRLVSDAVYASKAVRLIGRGEYTLTTAGDWVAAAELAVTGLFTAQETIFASYYTIAGQSVNAGTVVNFDTKVEDSHSIVSTGSSWRALVPATGIYEIKTRILFAPSTWSSVTFSKGATLRKNGVGVTDIALTWPTTTSSTGVYLVGSKAIKLSRGDYLDIIVSTNDGAKNLEAADVEVEIARISA